MRIVRCIIDVHAGKKENLKFFIYNYSLPFLKGILKSFKKSSIPLALPTFSKTFL